MIALYLYLSFALIFLGIYVGASNGSRFWRDLAHGMLCGITWPVWLILALLQIKREQHHQMKGKP